LRSTRQQNWNFSAVLAVVYSMLIVALFIGVSVFMYVEFGGATEMEADE
jgi:hypothetical protein